MLGAASALSSCGDRRAPEEASSVNPAQSAAPLAEAPVPAWKSTSKGLLADELDRVDPRKDGWDSEATHDAIKPRFYLVAKLLGASPVDADALAKVLTTEVASGPLRPALERTSAPEMAGFLVEREAPHATAPRFSGVSAFLAALEHLRSPFRLGSTVSFHVKIYRVDPGKTEAEAHVAAYVDVFGTGQEDQRIQQNADWKTTWHRASSGEWSLAAVESSHFEEVTLAQPRPLLEDCTESVLGALPAWREQLLHGLNHWTVRLESRLGLEQAGHVGAAVGDANGDGLDDLFYGDIGGLPKRLFLQNADGTLRDSTKEGGLDLLDRIRSSLFLDLDNDGDQDLVLGREDRLIFYENDGAAHFSRRSTAPVTPQVMSLAAADFDQDGDLDVYACSYGADATNFGDDLTPTPWHDANNGTPNALLRNDGKWKFTDATAATGLNENNSRFSFACVWEDYDNDGDADLFVVNDFGRKNLYQNQLTQSGQAIFRDVAGLAAAEDLGPGMGATTGDANGDGLMDIHVSNMFSGAGNRISFLPQYKPSSTEQTVAGHRRFARGNSLLLNRGDGTFSDVSEKANVTLGRWAWGSLWTDVNNDGWEDILVANGNITGIGTEDL